MNLQSNDFELFGLKQQFAQERDEVDALWKALQRQAHPDKFSAQDAAAQRVAMQWSVRINEAHQRLKDPVKRAAYLCELAGAPINLHSNTAMPAEFLMQQMQWREALDEAQGVEAVQALESEVRSARTRLLQQVASLIDQDHDFAAAAQAVRCLMFMEKFVHDLGQRLEALES
ncbi:MAG: Fe-S protein assembly co-chaperone HscB [Burkholderiales bacterium]|nr:Fe-S protein assembly co-chaperone HscB [Burkholderiales bacterium]